MATNFPGSLDSLTNPSSGDTLASPSHSSQHANANDAIEALQAKVGVNGSAVTTSIDYKLNNTVVDLTSAQSLYNKTVINSVVRSLEEAWAYSNQAISGAETINTTTTTAVYNYTAASGNFTLNVRGDASTTLNSLLDVNSSITVAWAVTNGATARYLTAFSVDGVAQTVKWQGGSAPTSWFSDSVRLGVFDAHYWF
jgi:hypothetical protein